MLEVVQHCEREKSPKRDKEIQKSISNREERKGFILIFAPSYFIRLDPIRKKFIQ
jgi:hypothetical protein